MMLLKSRSLARWGAIASLMVATCAAWTAPSFVVPQQTSVQAQEWIAASVDELKNSRQQWIQIDISTETLTAWEGDTPVYSVLVSTGRSDEPTPTGVFAIQSMHQEARMQGPDYDIPDVPYVMYYDGNYAIHGTYWHDSFGTPVSNGCTNMAVDHAQWLFDWASIGTPVVVQR